MNDLSVFLAQNAAPVENVKYVASKRFMGEDGKPVEWEIRPISSAENDTLRQSCMMRVPVPGSKRRRYTMDLDTAKYLGALAAASTAYPNLKSAELQDSYGVMGEAELLKAMLALPGELDDYYAEVQRINGFDETFEDKVDEAKN